MTALGTVVAVVPARRGSVRLPRKNLAEVGGRSLVARSIEVAHRVDRIAEVVVSSDDEEVLEEARRLGATADRRPPHLAGPEVPTMAVLEELLARHPADVLVVLQPTSPLRSADDVEACLDLLSEHPAATTVTRCDHPPAWVLRLTGDGLLEPSSDSWDDLQAAPSDHAVRLTGAVYAVRRQHLEAGRPLVGPETAAVLVPRERSIDIDVAFDLHLARLLADHPFTPDARPDPP